MTNAALLLVEATLYFTVMALLFRLRHRLGLGLFVCALGSMHFLETYLAAILYVEVAPGLLFSPGSVVLFSGKLALLLLIYIYEDAATVRQPIYGLFFGNVLVIALIALMRLHEVTPTAPGRMPDFAFIDQMGGLMVWGTVLLLVDSLLVILLFERSRHWFGSRLILRIGASVAAVLTFDQIGFFAALHLYTGAPLSVFPGGWVAKMAAACVYGVLAGLYVAWIEPRTDGRAGRSNGRLADLFEVLTYRERYEALLDRAGRDGLTGVYDRGQLEADGARLVEAALRAGRPCSLLMVDLDDFKGVNDRLGHLAGDELLREVARRIANEVRSSDRVYRYGGDEFLILCDGLPAGAAASLAQRLREAVARRSTGPGTSASIGVATGPEQGRGLLDLIAAADAELFRAKAARKAGPAPDAAGPALGQAI
ncbi:MAG TPA: GGDEF domain-containing protein [Microvirga sp.]|jgi:diguanylate cyclase (GGDEF)-like protein|nr:GGDEF domain-containing protein [Microvirga sp.]